MMKTLLATALVIATALISVVHAEYDMCANWDYSADIWTPSIDCVTHHNMEICE